MELVNAAFSRFSSGVHRFFLPTELTLREPLTLSPEDSHHAANVLRVRAGEAVIILDGVGTEIRGVIHSVSKQTVTVTVRERVRYPERLVQLQLAVALLKGRAWDAVLEKATELGAAVIQPLAAERSIVQVTAAVAQSKLAGWRATMIAAAKQCGTPWLPDFPNPTTPHDWLRSLGSSSRSPELRLVASLESGAGSIRAAVANFATGHGRRPQSVAVVVGPEGDFTTTEYAAFRAAGVVPFTLGSLVLRADTAAVAALAVAGAEMAAE